MSKKAYYEYHEQRYLTGIISLNDLERIVRTLGDSHIEKRLEEHKKKPR